MIDWLIANHSAFFSRANVPKIEKQCNVFNGIQTVLKRKELNVLPVH